MNSSKVMGKLKKVEKKVSTYLNLMHLRPLCRPLNMFGSVRREIQYLHACWTTFPAKLACTTQNLPKLCAAGLFFIKNPTKHSYLQGFVQRNKTKTGQITLFYSCVQSFSDYIKSHPWTPAAAQTRSTGCQDRKHFRKKIFLRKWQKKPPKSWNFIIIW